MIIVLTNTYPEYVKFMRATFPYYQLGIHVEKHFPSARLSHDPKLNHFMALERGTCYFNPYDLKPPDWFAFRFTKIRIDDTVPKMQSFGMGFMGMEENK